MSGLELFGYWRSSATWRVRIGFALKGLGYAYHSVHLRDGQQHDPGYVAKNRMHQVPTLRFADGAVLTQSFAILSWLDATHPEPALWPKDAFARARATEIAEIVNAGIQPLQNFSLLQRLRSLGVDPVQWSREVIARGFEALEPIVAETAGRFAVGDAVSIADLCLVPQLYNARRFDVDLTACSTLLKVEAACFEHPAFVSTRPESQPDAET